MAVRDVLAAESTPTGCREADFKVEAQNITNNPIKLLDVVALTVDLPQYNLWCGQVGTVSVETLAEGAAFEVEFSDRNGRTYESLGLRPEQIMVLHFEPLLPNTSTEMVTA